MGVLYVLDSIFDKVLNCVCEYLVIKFDMRTGIHGILYSELSNDQKKHVNFRSMIAERVLISGVLLFTILTAITIAGLVGYGVSVGIGL